MQWTVLGIEEDAIAAQLLQMPAFECWQLKRGGGEADKWQKWGFVWLSRIRIEIWQSKNNKNTKRPLMALNSQKYGFVSYNIHQEDR